MTILVSRPRSRDPLRLMVSVPIGTCAAHRDRRALSTMKRITAPVEPAMLTHGTVSSSISPAPWDQLQCQRGAMKNATIVLRSPNEDSNGRRKKSTEHCDEYISNGPCRFVRSNQQVGLDRDRRIGREPTEQPGS